MQLEAQDDVRNDGDGDGDGVAYMCGVCQQLFNNAAAVSTAAMTVIVVSHRGLLVQDQNIACSATTKLVKKKSRG